MKIQCDVCRGEEAAVFCTADEAALCDTCDHKVHHANKLASKHRRFSLLHPSSKNIPICDVCQEKRAFLFCQQDRAILCRDCDVPIHTANEHTQKHTRFLLSGVKLSATSAPYISSVPNGGDNLVPDSCPSQQQEGPLVKKSPVSVTKTGATTSNKSLLIPNSLPTHEMVNKGGGNNLVSSEGIGYTSSISEYLMETLPGWHVEDFLDSSSTPFGFSKSDDDGTLPFEETDLERYTDCLATENLGIWVPQAPSLLHQSQHFADQMRGQSMLLKETKEATNILKASNRRWAGADDAFTVPQISPPSTGSKRPSRSFW